MKSIRWLLIILVFPVQGLAQNKKYLCQNCLSAANISYTKGEYREAINLLTMCMNSSGLRKNKDDAYRLLSMCYLRMPDADTAAKKWASRLLKRNPGYKFFPYEDPRDFSNLIASFEVKPRWSIGVNAGFNYSLPSLQKGYSIKPAGISTQGNAGPFLGLNAHYFFKNDQLVMTTWVNYSLLTFRQKLTFKDFEEESVAYREEQSSADLGFCLRFLPFEPGRLRPFAGIGMEYEHILTAQSRIEYFNDYLESDSEDNGEPVSENGRNMLRNGVKNRNIWYGILEGGLKWKAGKGDMELGFRYKQSFSNNIHAENRFANVRFNLEEQWVDSDIRLNAMILYTAYSIPVKWHVYPRKNKYKL